MRKADTPTTTKDATALTTAYAGWEFSLGTGGSLSGVVELELVFGGAATLTLRWINTRSGGDDYERAKTIEGVSSPDVHVVTIADYETVDTTKKRIAIPVNVKHGTRVKLQAKVDATTGTPTLAAGWLPDNQAKG